LTDQQIETDQYPILISALTEMKSYVKHSMDRKNGGSVVFLDRRVHTETPKLTPIPPKETPSKGA
jgi:hypothetical protein